MCLQKKLEQLKPQSYSPGSGMVAARMSTSNPFQRETKQLNFKAQPRLKLATPLSTTNCSTNKDLITSLLIQQLFLLASDTNHPLQMIKQTK